MLDSRKVGEDLSQESLERRRTQMVLYELEQALGQLIIRSCSSHDDLPKALVRGIVEKSRRELDESDVADIVGATYFGDLLPILLHIFAKNSLLRQVKRLDALFKILEVYDVRNSVSHPNRTFPPAYWRRIAALAADPCVLQLGLDSVTAALASAEAGRIERPPDSWLELYQFSIPNNLPDTVEHRLTGLVGRDKEKRELLKLLKNPRAGLIALVGPGGVGKTALVLDVLKDASREPLTTSWAEQILYVTAKEERLTVEGSVHVKPQAATLDSVRRLAEAAKDSLTHNSDSPPKRVLLCIDNLETLLRDSPSEFDDFYLELPREWRVLVTTRVNVNSATMMPLGALSKGGAISLARAYSARRGAAGIPPARLQQLADELDRNPLAIRLAIDAYAMGHPLPSATVEVRQQIVEFSYKHLVDALSEDSRGLLECLFTTGRETSRIEAGLLLQLDVDRVADAFRELAGTALVARHHTQDEEKYVLSAGARELLVMSAVRLDTRVAVEKAMRTQDARTLMLGEDAASSNLARSDLSYVPPDTPESIVNIVDRVRSALKSESRTRILRAQKQVSRALESKPQNAILNRLYGVLANSMRDRVTAILHLRLATFATDTDVCAALELSRMYRTGQQIPEALEVCERLREIGGLETELMDEESSYNITKEYWLSRLWMGDLDETLQATEHWDSSGSFRKVLGSIRAQALRQKLDNSIRPGSISESASRKLSCVLVEALRIWDSLISSSGYTGGLVDSAAKLLHTARLAVQRSLIRERPALLEACRFISRHLGEFCSVHEDQSFEDHNVKLVVAQFSRLKLSEQNPLEGSLWDEIASSVPTSQTTVSPLVRVKVTKRPTCYQTGDLRDFLFANDPSGESFIIYVSQLEDAKACWTQILVGDELLITPRPDVPRRSDFSRKVFRAARV